MLYRIVSSKDLKENLNKSEDQICDCTVINTYTSNVDQVLLAKLVNYPEIIKNCCKDDINKIYGVLHFQTDKLVSGIH